MNSPVVSIIIPVFNAANSVIKSLDSIVHQSYSFIEIVVVNDASTDETLSVIEQFFESQILSPNLSFKVVSHATNRGVAAARNTGLDCASGEYIYYVDADDWIDRDCIEILVQESLSGNADIVGCNWFLCFEKNERAMIQPVVNSGWDAIDKMMRGVMRWNLWLFMVKRSLYEQHNVRFLPGCNMGEDLMVMTKLLTYCARIVHANKACYHYVQTNQESLTKIYSQRHKEEVAANIEEIEKFLRSSIFASQIGDRLLYLKLNIKLPLLMSDQVSRYRAWLIWFAEANHVVMANKALPIRIRLLQLAAVKGQFWFLKMYHIFVFRMIYGVFYK